MQRLTVVMVGGGGAKPSMIIQIKHLKKKIKKKRIGGIKNVTGESVLGRFGKGKGKVGRTMTTTTIG